MPIDLARLAWIPHPAAPAPDQAGGNPTHPNRSSRRYTRRHISVGDQITVFGVLDVITYDASEILNADGQPACPR